MEDPLSTFSIDVDTASYSNARRFINQGKLPPKDAVRVEELINYFAYDYPQPTGNTPFSISTELASCPWQPKHQLLHIGLQGKAVPSANTPPSNLVFLLDVSGSMNAPDKLPLLKSSFQLLVEQLTAKNRIAIVVYAGAAGEILPSTPANQKDKILQAIRSLEAAGSTAGGQGIERAYQIAEKNFIKNGNNRVILATDGDFNVGISSNAELVRLIEEKRQSGVLLSVLGFGQGNLKDSKMEQLAKHGNGNYAYIDNATEAKKVLVSEIGGTLNTIAKDVKIQLEFNPAKVKEYRLVGYENRLLENRDFEDDSKDAGELGSGHSVTALYGIIPQEAGNNTQEGRYQSTTISEQAQASNELGLLKLRYKSPQGLRSKLIEKPIEASPRSNPSTDFRFAAAVAEYGMLLRDSEFKGRASYARVLAAASAAQGADREGYRKEFLKLVRKSRGLKR